jgi:hypothetical protein
LPRQDAWGSRGDAGSVLGAKYSFGTSAIRAENLLRISRNQTETTGKTRSILPNGLPNGVPLRFYKKRDSRLAGILCAQGHIFAGQCASDWTLTILRPILAEAFHSPVKTRCGLVLTGQCGFCTACDEEYKRKEEKPLGLYVIMHIFEVPARNQYAATGELMLARKHNFDKVFLKKVIVKEAGVKPVREKVNVFAPKPLLESEPRSRRPASM